jgi:hypothetical protein
LEKTKSIRWQHCCNVTNNLQKQCKQG